MTASTNQPQSAKCRRPILIALIALSALSFMVHARPRKERLLAQMNECLREGDFGRLYDGADDSVRRNVTREKFVRRMNIAAAKLREIDGGLHFKRDAAIEQVISGEDDPVILSAAQTLERDGKSVTILFHWDKKGRFFDLSVLPKPGTPEGYAVYGVSYNQLRVGDRLLDY